MLDDFKSTHLNNTESQKLRKDITVRYYVKEKDDSVVYKLKDYGFYIHERETAKPFKNLRSNAVFYGDSISLEDLKAVCFVLHLGGLPLRTIELSKYHSDWKSNSIEVGTDTTVLDLPPLNIQDIIDLDFNN